MELTVQNVNGSGGRLRSGRSAGVVAGVLERGSCQ